MQLDVPHAPKSCESTIRPGVVNNVVYRARLETAQLAVAGLPRPIGKPAPSVLNTGARCGSCGVQRRDSSRRIEHAESVLSSKLRRNVAVVTPTGFGARSAKAEVGSAVWNEAGKIIPFFGILNSLACIGHSVWLFDVTSDIEAACRDSDVLIIDSEVAGSLADDRITAARRVMRGSSILIHDRATYQLRPLASEKSSDGGWSAVFDTARLCTQQGDRRQVVMVRPDKSLLCILCIPRNAMTANQHSQAHRLIPEGSSRNVVVIAPTELDCGAPGNGAPPAVAQLRAAGKAIPFFGLLINLASAGNPLWIFEGQKEVVPHGCRQASARNR